MTGWGLLADLVVVIHLLFVGFAVLGAIICIKWPCVAWVHLPCVVWAAWVEISGGICPLTPLEVMLRRRAGGAGYETGFVEQYLIPVLYPPGLTPEIQVWLGILVLLINAGGYGWVIRRMLKRKKGN